MEGGRTGTFCTLLGFFFPPVFFQFCLTLSTEISRRRRFHVLNSLNNNNLLVLVSSGWVSPPPERRRECSPSEGLPKKLWHPLKRLFLLFFFKSKPIKKMFGTTHAHDGGGRFFPFLPPPTPTLVVCDVTWTNKRRNFKSEASEKCCQVKLSGE